ncbi:M48 family metallopeptidase [Fundidesulfovibrio agrisoli]|uniref:M48 family metallopeptidase n=1 Tax=Fundidesulfovibrio agrisoli TaxID=2922717 RepID=UPI001FABE508|nr:M48 family metallopeptidase [Fundidesulfovibrio agrisoli]
MLTPIRFLTLFMVSLLLCACQTTPYSQKSQLNLVSREDELAMGKGASQRYLSTVRTCRDRDVARRIKRIGKAIAEQAGVPDANWQFHCVENGQFQAFCFPGGIIVIYSGVANACETDDQLAAIIGHEAGHAIARHTAKLLSKKAVTDVIAISLGSAMAAGNGAAAQGNADGLSALASVGLLLPSSRENEYEADTLGMVLMAKAGYDPAQAVEVWRKLVDKNADRLGKKSEKLSTHPTDTKRLEAIQAYVETARTHAPGAQATAPAPDPAASSPPEAPAAP